MALFSFYSVRKPRQFNHQPIYYNPHKEEMDARKQRIRRELGLEGPDPNEYKSHIRGSFIEGTTHLKKSRLRGDDSRSRTYKNGKLIAFALLLGLILWFLIK
jgi:hypothetical protein